MYLKLHELLLLLLHKHILRRVEMDTQEVYGWAPVIADSAVLWVVTAIRLGHQWSFPLQMNHGG